MPKVRILLIDDEWDICYLIKRQLDQAGDYEVEVACSGEEGVAKFERMPFDLVITDYEMPGIDGEEVLRQIKGTALDVPVVLFSVFGDDTAVVSSSLLSQFDGRLQKLADCDRIHYLIESLLAGQGVAA